MSILELCYLLSNTCFIFYDQNLFFLNFSLSVLNFKIRFITRLGTIVSCAFHNYIFRTGFPITIPLYLAGRTAPGLLACDGLFVIS